MYYVFNSENNEGGSSQEERKGIPMSDSPRAMRRYREIIESSKKIGSVIIGQNRFGDDGIIYDALDRPIRRYRP